MTNEEAIEIINRENDPNDTKVWELFPEYREALDMAIKALSQEPICDRDCEHCTWTECPIEPCEDAISREAVLSLWGLRLSDKEIYMAIHNMESVTPSRRKGHWIKGEEWCETIDGFEQWGNEYMCSECGHVVRKNANYCDECGAEMESDTDAT